MQYTKLGRTGITVSRACLGGMMFGSWGNTDHDECLAIIQEAGDSGVNFIDTSDVYSYGESEEIIGKAIAGNRSEWVISTKYANPMGEGENRSGASRRWITQACEDSLRRLNTDYIDLYIQHRPDWDTDIDETLGALSDLVRAGKIRAFGSSNFSAVDMLNARHTADARGRERFRCEQLGYSILVRGAERDRLPLAAAQGMGIMCWSPLAGGWLTGMIRRGGQMPTSEDLGNFRALSRYSAEGRFNQAKLDAVEALIELADEAGLSIVHLGLAFVREHPAVTAPIMGPKNLTELRDLLAGADVVLSQDTLDRIDAIVPPGFDIHPNDSRGFVPPELQPAGRRRGLAAGSDSAYVGFTPRREPNWGVKNVTA
ncbi:Aldo/keto reductase [Frankia canadensis]|uniref:Aldo/keto reductase n=1 Tax=Frankia canadensis TaxID=1836972 RepID=A0A2I2KI47_9ACTN|nr:aldo/keto reductase [Frankia canadensis]SNQ45334.1 Aldo/keto reductase [Frankia canadensis]SOU52624.1 Aldo/keto reductase [Frankia canadensis]